MRELAELQEEIERKRVELDRMMESAVRTGNYDDVACYRVSVELDGLIEQYIEMENAMHLSV